MRVTSPGQVADAVASRAGPLPSGPTTPRPRAQVSTIVPLLENPATSFQPSAVVTEHVVAAVRGRTERQQAAALIDVAHPDVREELAEEARFLGLG